MTNYTEMPEPMSHTLAVSMRVLGKEGIAAAIISLPRKHQDDIDAVEAVIVELASHQTMIEVRKHESKVRVGRR